MESSYRWTSYDVRYSLFRRLLWSWLTRSVARVAGKVSNNNYFGWIASWKTCRWMRSSKRSANRFKATKRLERNLPSTRLSRWKKGAALSHWISLVLHRICLSLFAAHLVVSRIVKGLLQPTQINLAFMPDERNMERETRIGYRLFWKKEESWRRRELPRGFSTVRLTPQDRETYRCKVAEWNRRRGNIRRQTSRSKTRNKQQEGVNRVGRVIERKGNWVKVRMRGEG